MPSLPSALAALGWSDRWVAHWAAIDHPAAEPARVVRTDADTITIATATGERRLPRHVGGHDPAVGDWVAALPDRVHAVLPRHGVLRRADPDHGEQVLAANVDVLLAVCGLDRPVKPGRVQRATVQAWDAGATPVVVLTKTDLMESDAVDALVEELADQLLGADVHAVSPRTGAGVEPLATELAGHTVALLGESGAGKSTLLNALAGHEVAATAEVRTGDGKGRHTTTHRQLHQLRGDLVVVDLPGIRALGLAAEPETVDGAFPAVEALAAACRFRDCAHQGEPGCAVAEAAEIGELDPAVLQAYRRLRREAESEARRAVEHERRAAERRFARVVKDAQSRKGRR